ncbi:MAG: sigma-54-dependent Fis family transcriptional regulator [Phycisphaerales bacterium]|nr:sigma-54-dependent Fis family transcriptional regulator [Phycisphaerales bacterium]
MSIRVLVVEDESLIRWSIRKKLTELGHQVTEADCGKAASAALQSASFDLVLLDYRLPDTTGLDLLRELRAHDHDTAVIMMTAYSTIENAVEAIKLGAFDYLSKPFEMETLVLTIEKALATTHLRREVRDLRRRLREDFGFDRIIGRHPSMLELFDVMNRVARGGGSTVFLRGETGTGKDLVAHTIHHDSDRTAAPFMNITCTAIAESLLESELFGHERGAFTDARAQKQGLFEQADGGTVFLDEVGDMPLGLQAKLLRFLEERTFRRVGGTQEITVDVRVIAATNADINRAVRNGRFRRDLLFRLDVVPIVLPPLRERGDDVRLLTDFFVTRFAGEFKRNVTRIDEEAYARLAAHPWPGNVRELRNACERAVLLGGKDTLTPDDFPLGRVDHFQPGNPFLLRLPPGGVDFDAIERRLLKQALDRCHQNRSHAAALVHMSRDTFRYRLQKHDLL